MRLVKVRPMFPRHTIICVVRHTHGAATTEDTPFTLLLSYLAIHGDLVILSETDIQKTHPHSILQVPTTQLENMSIDPKVVELTADVLKIFS